MRPMLATKGTYVPRGEEWVYKPRRRFAGTLVIDGRVVGPETLERLKELGMGSMMVLPMRLAGTVIGTLNFVNDRDRRPFDDFDVNAGGTLNITATGSSATLSFEGTDPTAGDGVGTEIDFVDDLANIVPAVLTRAMLGFPMDDYETYVEPIHAAVYTKPGSDPILLRLQNAIFCVGVLAILVLMIWKPGA